MIYDLRFTIANSLDPAALPSAIGYWLSATIS